MVVVVLARFRVRPRLVAGARAAVAAAAAVGSADCE